MPQPFTIRPVARHISPQDRLAPADRLLRDHALREEGARTDAITVYENACRKLAFTFWREYFYENDSGEVEAWQDFIEDDYSYCVGDDPTDVWFFGDSFWGTHIMAEALKLKVDYDTLMGWYWERVEKPEEAVSLRYYIQQKQS